MGINVTVNSQVHQNNVLIDKYLFRLLISKYPGILITFGKGYLSIKAEGVVEAGNAFSFSMTNLINVIQSATLRHTLKLFWLVNTKGQVGMTKE